METTIKKNQTAKVPTKAGKEYSYQYVDIAQIHEYLESIGASYYQYIDTNENGKDYVVTVPIIDGKELLPRRGCQVVDATLMGVNNPAQQQGSALTYARRYSLLMAFGLATEDDDAQSLSKPKEITEEQAKAFKFTNGKYANKSILEVYEEDKKYLEWWINNKPETDISKMIQLITDIKPVIVTQNMLNLTNEIMLLVQKKGIDLEKIHEHYKHSSLMEYTEEELKDCKERLSK